MQREHRPYTIPGLKPRHERGNPSSPCPPDGAGRPCSRREFLRTGAGSLALAALAPWTPGALAAKPVVAITRVGKGGVPRAVEEALELLGGAARVSVGRERILLKPNLVGEGPGFTTSPQVVRALAELFQRAGKEVSIGEGSAAGSGFNLRGGVQYRTRNRAILDPMQAYVFERLGYTELAGSLRVPLVNLHSGELAEVPLRDGYVFERITLHRALLDTDMLVSVPMMKTHSLATVTLGMKNLIGLYPGTVYYSARSWLHDRAAQAHSPGVAYEIVDMVRVNKLGLTVIDGTRAMEGNGPTGGDVFDFGIIVAGTNPLATDMVGAAIMGFAPGEVPTFAAAWGRGMTPRSLDDVEVRGAPIAAVRRPFKRPAVVPWTTIGPFWAAQELT